MKYINISVARANKLVDQGAKLIDTRPATEFAKGTLLGATNIVLRNVSTISTKFKKTDTLILFGVTDTDTDVNQFQNYAEQLGFTNVYSIGSIENWNLL
jgi:rhodanese-related sulfurtransferase